MNKADIEAIKERDARIAELENEIKNYQPVKIEAITLDRLLSHNIREFKNLLPARPRDYRAAFNFAHKILTDNAALIAAIKDHIDTWPVENTDHPPFPSISPFTVLLDALKEAQADNERYREQVSDLDDDLIEKNAQNAALLDALKERDARIAELENKLKDYQTEFKNMPRDYRAALNFAHKLRTQNAALIAAAVHIYNHGYHTGHEDTVEGGYTHIYPADMGEYHAEEVRELLADLLTEAQGEPARTPLQCAFPGCYDCSSHTPPQCVERGCEGCLVCEPEARGDG